MSDAQKDFDALVAKLHETDHALITWIGSTPAYTPEEITQVKRVLAMRGSLQSALAELRLIAYAGSVAALTQPMEDLSGINARINAAAKDIQAVKDIITFAAEAVALAVQILALAATL